MTNPAWKQFEIAVAAFLSALDPSAKVVHDTSIPDLDTGTPRQRDVWIETTIFGHWPVKIYVSCKNEKDRLSQQDIDAVIGELRSSGADIGVIYALGGFSENALAKAKKVGLHCCQLFENASSVLPPSLLLPCFMCMPDQIFTIEGDVTQVLGVCTYEELFAFSEGDPEGRPLIEHFDEMYLSTVKEVVQETFAKGGLPPELVETTLSLTNPSVNRTVTFHTAFGFQFYAGKLEHYLVNGSYCLTTGDFKGSQSFPPVLMGEGFPGPYWSPVSRADIDRADTCLCVVIHGHKFGEHLALEMHGAIPTE